MHINQTYRRETPKEIAARIMAGKPGTPVFTSELKGEGKHISTLDVLEAMGRKQFA